MGLFKPAWMNNDRETALSAVKKLTNQAGLARVAKHSKHDDVRILAAEKLDDKPLAQTVYTEIAKNQRSDYRLLVAGRLDDTFLAQRVYTDIATDHEYNDDSRIEAANRLDNKDRAQKVYAEIAKNSNDFWLRLNTIKKLDDKSLAQTMYAELAKAIMKYNSSMDRDMYDEKCEKVMEKLTDQAALADVAQNAKSSYVGELAQKKLAELS